MTIKITKTEYGFAGLFNAMASPCECLIESSSYHIAKSIIQIAANEAWRIEKKYSRYIKNNLCYRINNSNGKPVTIDQETFHLLEFANTCYQISDGLFDLTSGILRRVWTFKPNAKIPTQEEISKLFHLIGWQHVSYDQNNITLKPNMEIDFGGIGKEYAVDKAAQKILDFAPDVSVVVNFGGDIRVTSFPSLKEKWQIGIDSLMTGVKRSVAISIGAVCTSGDTERYIINQGKRYSHLINPKTGWPTENSPHTVTVIADQCLQAGLFASLAMIQGKDAERFLQQQNVKFHCQR